MHEHDSPEWILYTNITITQERSLRTMPITPLNRNPLVQYSECRGNIDFYGGPLASDRMENEIYIAFTTAHDAS